MDQIKTRDRDRAMKTRIWIDVDVPERGFFTQRRAGQYRAARPEDEGITST
jgi:hypothetical protein